MTSTILYISMYKLHLQKLPLSGFALYLYWDLPTCSKIKKNKNKKLAVSEH